MKKTILDFKQMKQENIPVSWITSYNYWQAKAAEQVERVSAAAPSSTTRPKNPKELAKFLEERAAARQAR